MPLQLNLAPPPFLTVQFADGTTAASRAVSINSTYGQNWLGGGPDAEWTANYLQRIERSYADENPQTRPYIVPVEPQILDHPGRTADRAIHLLPRIRLAAIFTSAATDYFDDEASPNLFIIWHQDDLASLMSHEVIECLSKQYWSTLTNAH